MSRTFTLILHLYYTGNIVPKAFSIPIHIKKGLSFLFCNNTYDFVTLLYYIIYQKNPLLVTKGILF